MEKIKDFLSVSSGSGYGDGSGSGDGSGYGYGSGSGDGSGDGSGYGYGYGSGNGYGSGYGYGYGSGNGSGDGYGSGYGYGSGSGDGYGNVKSFDNKPVYIIDGVPTIILKIVGNLAKACILEKDFTLTPCFVAKGKNQFAHGSTFGEAMSALQDKIFESMDTDAKVNAFLKEVSLDTKYPAKFFYDWHHRLTGSCEMGRNRFVRDHDIDLENGEYTVREFIEITQNDFGGNIIRELKERITDA